MAEKSLVNDDAEIDGTEPLDALLEVLAVDGVLDELLVLLELELPHAASANAAVIAHTAVMALPLSKCIYLLSRTTRRSAIPPGEAAQHEMTHCHGSYRLMNEPLTSVARS
jgi:hypothetical protein